MNSDHQFVIGSRHVNQGSPCQDYAQSGAMLCPTGEEVAYAVISDGCSQVISPDGVLCEANTDIGSRVITQAFVRALSTILTSYTIGLEVLSFNLHKAELFQTLEAHFSLMMHNWFNTWDETKYQKGDFYATLVAAVAYRDEVYVYMIGDGAFVLKDINGGIHVCKTDWPGNTPVYLADLMDHSPAGKEKIGRHFGAMKKADLGVNVTNSTYSSVLDGELSTSFSLDPETTREGMLFGPLDRNLFSTVSVVSDGLFQFSGQSSLFDVTTEMVGYKNLAGSFVKRRTTKALKSLEKAGVVPVDDFSIATINLNSPEET